MAAVLLMASPYAMRYQVTASGAGNDDTLTQAQLISDAAEGPLKSLLQSTAVTGSAGSANNAWVALGADPALSVFVAPAGSGAGPALIGYLFDLVGGGLTHTLRMVAAGAGRVILELRFNSTVGR